MELTEMSIKTVHDYKRVAEAITFIQKNYKSQPSLEEIAESIHLSPFHFQRLFTEWAGTSPKKFLQYISLTYAKHLLSKKQATLFEATHQVGLSGTSRLHDLFVQIEGMTPAEYKQGGKNLVIHYQYAMSPFGNILIASTTKGICYLSFFEEAESALLLLKAQFPNAMFSQKTDVKQQKALAFFQRDTIQLPQLKFHLKGTDFQLKVWESLLTIPVGNLTSYGEIAKQAGHPAAVRAVGTAIGRNPVSFLIPCHRVIQSTGFFGQYLWGSARKTAMIGWESALVNMP